MISFLNRVTHFDADLELLDGISILQSQGKLYDSGTRLLFNFIDENQHPTLSKRKDNSHNRLMAINHLKASFYGGCIKDIYEYLTIYFQDILKSSAMNGIDPDRLIGEHKTSFDANILLKCNSHSEVIELISRSVFRNLENEKSTIKLIEKINKKLDLSINEHSIKNAMPYLELRHLLVHADGKIDQKFINSYPDFEPEIVKINSKIKLNHEIVRDAKLKITTLVEEYDTQVIHKKLIHNDELQN